MKKYELVESNRPGFFRRMGHLYSQTEKSKKEVKMPEFVNLDYVQILIKEQKVWARVFGVYPVSKTLNVYIVGLERPLPTIMIKMGDVLSHQKENPLTPKIPSDSTGG